MNYKNCRGRRTMREWKIKLDKARLASEIQYKKIELEVMKKSQNYQTCGQGNPVNSARKFAAKPTNSTCSRTIKYTGIFLT